MGLVRAFINVIKTLGYTVTGRLDEVSALWGSNPAAIRAKGAAGIAKKKERLGQIAKALEPMHIQVKRAETKIAEKTKRLAEIPGLINGARARAQEIATSKGLSKEQAATDPEVNRWLKALGGYMEEQKRLQGEIDATQKSIAGTAARRTTLLTQAESLKKEIQEAGALIDDTVAAVVSAREETAANAAYAGLATGDTGDEELKSLREMRDRAEGQAAAVRDMAGTEVSAIEAELKAAGSQADNAGLLDLLDFGDKTPATVGAEKLPEH